MEWGMALVMIQNTAFTTRHAGLRVVMVVMVVVMTVVAREAVVVPRLGGGGTEARETDGKQAKGK